MDEYLEKFKKRSTSALIKRYRDMNPTYRAHARAELMKRKVPKKMLPWKPKTTVKRRTALQPFGFRW